jgi:hypothetical protein
MYVQCRLFEIKHACNLTKNKQAERLAARSRHAHNLNAIRTLRVDTSPTDVRCDWIYGRVYPSLLLRLNKDELQDEWQDFGVLLPKELLHASIGQPFVLIAVAHRRHEQRRAGHLEAARS